MHVPSKSCMQEVLPDSGTILHDLASSFLLGWNCAKKLRNLHCQGEEARDTHNMPALLWE